MKKVIFIAFVANNREYEKNCFMNDLISSGFTVEYWDISRIYFKNLVYEREINRDYIKKFATFDALCRAIKAEDIQRTAFVLLILYTGKTWPLFRLLSRFNCRMFFFAWGLLPIMGNNNFLDRWRFRCRYFLSVRRLMDAACTKFALILKASKCIREYERVFTAGSCADELYKGTSSTVKINYWDYDQYLSARESKTRAITGKYCVFIDDNLIKCDDNEILGIKTIDGKKYYDALNAFFKFVESKFNIKVVVAANPFSMFKGDEFDGRDVYKYKTNELVRDSEFVMAHFSSSTAYPVLYKKPVVFIYMEQMKAQYYFSIIANFSRTLHSALVNIDDENEVNAFKIESPDLDAYNAYKYKYLTSKETENQFSRNIVIDSFNECLSR